MSKHDDLLDDYIGYRIFEDSFKSSKPSGSKPTNPPPIRMTKKSSDLGCGGWIALICIAIALISIFGSCGKSSSKSYSSGYRSIYSYSYGSSGRGSSSYGSGSSSRSSSNKTYSSSTSKPSSFYCSGSKFKSSSSDPYDAKSYAHPEDLYYEYPDDFWDYEDAEDYWYEYNND